MRPLVSLCALTLVVGLAGGADAAKGSGKSKNMVHGYVTAVDGDATKGGSITIRVQHKKKGASGAAAVEKTVKFSASTRFEVVQGKKGAVQTKAADLTSVQKGEHVLVILNGADATDVKVIKKGKAKKQST